MSKESYFAQYVSPNIVIVPTVSFTPPRIEKIPATKCEYDDKDLSGPTSTCKKDEEFFYTPPLKTHLDVNFNTKDGGGTPPDPIKSKSKEINEISTEVASKTVNQGDKELSSSIYRSRNNLVESQLKEFKKKSTEVPSKNVNQDTKELSSPIGYRSRNNLVDLTGFNMLKREIKRSKSQNKDNTEIVEDVLTKKPFKKDVTKYLVSDDNSYKEYKSKKELYKESRETNCCERISKLIESETNRRTGMEDKMKKRFKYLIKRNIESMKDRLSKENGDKKGKSTKVNSKDLKQEHSRSKSKLKSEASKPVLKDSKDISKEYNDFKKKFIAEYSKRSKTESKSTGSLERKMTIKERKEYLSSIAMKRYEDFQRYLRHHKDDDDIQHKSTIENKIKRLHERKENIKTVLKKPEIKKILDRKQSIKTARTNEIKTDITDTDRVNSIRSVVQVKKLTDNNSPSNSSDSIDLRSKLSRKRTRKECSHSKLTQRKMMDRENLIISVEQNVNTDPKISAKLTPPVNKPKSKKYKKIKLVINIECPPATDSDDSDQTVNECCSPPQDLSFLDDFNVDEIVDSLNIYNQSPIKNNKMTKAETSRVINKINETENICMSEESNPNDGLIDDLIKRAKKISNVDITEDDFRLKTGSVYNSSKINNQPTVKVNVENESLTTKDVTTSKPNQNEKINVVNSKQKANQIYQIKDNKTFNLTKNNPSKITKKPHLSLNKSKDPVEASLETIFNPNKQMDTNFDKNNIKLKSDPIEKSLETMFNVESSDNNIDTKETKSNNIGLNTKNNNNNIAASKKTDKVIKQYSKTVVFEAKQNKNQQTSKTNMENKRCDKFDNKNSKADIENNVNKINRPTIIPNTNIKENAIKRLQKSKCTNESLKTNKNNKDMNCKLTIQKDNKNKAHSKEISGSKRCTREQVEMHVEKSKDTTRNTRITADVHQTIEPTKRSHSNIKKTTELLQNKPNKIANNNHNTENKTDIIKLYNASKEIRIKKSKNVTEKSYKTPMNKKEKESGGEKLVCFKTAEIPVQNKYLQTDVVKNVKYSEKSENSPKKSLEKIKAKEKDPSVKNTGPVNISNNNIKEKEKHLQTPKQTINSTVTIAQNVEQNTHINMDIKSESAEREEDVPNTKEANKINLDLESTFTAEKNVDNPIEEVSNKSEQNTVKCDVQPLNKVDNSIQHKVTPNIALSTLSNKEKDACASSIESASTEEESHPTVIKKEDSKPESNNSDTTIIIPDTDTKAKQTGSSEPTNIEIKPTRKFNYQPPYMRVKKGLEIKPADKLSLPSLPSVQKIETRLLGYFEKLYKITSIIQKGHFSVIYKCKDDNGNEFALKMSNTENKVSTPKVFSTSNKFISPFQELDMSLDNSYLLYLFNGFSVHGHWCFLTEYYPKNLNQALDENGKGFHIDMVQDLSRQLISAVNMLTNSEIAHTDIKPHHILLNISNTRLRLCGFDRCMYRPGRMFPSFGTPSYRAPEIILGFVADYRVDVWSTALVMFEMLTTVTLFPGHYNNDILYKHVCTLGSFEIDMIENSEFGHVHFHGPSFLRRYGNGGKQIQQINIFHKNNRLRREIYKSYKCWEPSRTKWQATKDFDKLETFSNLLEQMLVLDPRLRLPITFVRANEFIHDMYA